MKRININTIVYVAHSAIVDIKRGWKLHLVLVICLTLGMLLPILCLGNVNVFVEKFATIHLKDSKNTLIISVEEGFAVPYEINSVLLDAGISFDNFAVTATSRCLVERVGVSNRLYVYQATENILDFETMILREGTMDIFSSANLCLADESMVDVYEGLSVGDTITISGNPYTVAGIVSSLNIKDFVIPLSDDQAETAMEANIDKIYLHRQSSISEWDQITESLKSIGLINIELQKGEQVYQNTLLLGLGKVAVTLLVALLACCFAAINTSLILTGKLMQDKQVVGIRMAVGASPKLTFLGILTENLMCYIVAFLLDFGLVWLISPTIPVELQMIMDTKVYTIAFLFGIVMVLMITAISMQWLRKQKVVTLIERIS